MLKPLSPQPIRVIPLVIVAALGVIWVRLAVIQTPSVGRQFVRLKSKVFHVLHLEKRPGRV